MALRYCFEQDLVKKTLAISKKNDLAVIDCDGIPDDVIMGAANRGVHIYGYLNACALEKERSYYNKYKDLIIIPYDGWPNEYWVDVTDRRWQKHLIDTAKRLKTIGVKGLYFDNTDLYYLCKEGFLTDKPYKNANFYIPGSQEVYKALKKVAIELQVYQGITVMPNGGDLFVKRFVTENPGILKTVNQEGVIYEEFKKQSNGEKKYRTEYLDWCKKHGLYIRGIEYCKRADQKLECKAYYKIHGWQGLYISKHHTLKGD